jgi:hypothetical protein
MPPPSKAGTPNSSRPGDASTIFSGKSDAEAERFERDHFADGPMR